MLKESIFFEENLGELLDKKKYGEICVERKEIINEIRCNENLNIEFLNNKKFNDLDIICIKQKGSENLIDESIEKLKDKVEIINNSINMSSYKLNRRYGEYIEFIFIYLNKLNAIASLTEYMMDYLANGLYPFAYIDVVRKEIGNSVTTYQRILGEELRYITRDTSKLIKNLEKKYEQNRSNVFEYFNNKKLNNSLDLLCTVLDVLKIYENLYTNIYAETSYGLASDLFNEHLINLKGYSKTIDCIYEKELDLETIEEIRNSILELLK